METAKVAYEAYGKFTDWKNYRGDPMPTWEDLPQPTRNAWHAAIEAAKQAACPAF